MITEIELRAQYLFLLFVTLNFFLIINLRYIYLTLLLIKQWILIFLYLK